MIRSILLAVDKSGAARCAQDLAMRYADRLKGYLTGVFIEDRALIDTTNTYNLAAYGDVGFDALIDPEERKRKLALMQVEGQELMSRFIEEAREKKIPHAFKVIRDYVPDGILNLAQAADMVIVGRRGTNPGHDPKEPGENTLKILHKANRPVLVVPEMPQVGQVVGLAYDGSAGSNRALRVAAEMAMRMEMFLRVLTVKHRGTDPEPVMEAARRYLDTYPLQYELLRKDDGPAARISELAQTGGLGLLVMGAYGHGPLTEFVFGSTTTQVLRRIYCPTLLCH
ncbi:MAG TPA: universal stress protein [Planctomycetota bacterium]|nr:universal stress protein [Planctomycetota bacterium]